MDKKLNYKDFVNLGVIRKMGELEKKDYISFYDNAWKDDLEVSESLVNKSPKWSIISGYYAMHDVVKLFLAKNYGVKKSGKFVHAATIEALKYFLKKQKPVELIEKAFNKVSFLPEFLEFGRKERSKAQYYSLKRKKTSVKEAKEFLEDIVKPFIKTIKRLMKDV